MQTYLREDSVAAGIHVAPTVMLRFHVAECTAKKSAWYTVGPSAAE